MDCSSTGEGAEGASGLGAAPVRDVGLALLAAHNELSVEQEQAPALQSGRLLHCRGLSGQGVEALRRARTVVYFAEGAGAASQGDGDTAGHSGARYLDVEVPMAAEGLLTPDMVKSALQELFRIIEQGAEFPILLSSSLTGFSAAVAAAVLAALGAAAEVASAVFETLALGADCGALKGLLDRAAGAEAVSALGLEGHDLGRICTLLCGPLVEQRVTEIAWLKQDLRVMYKLLGSADGTQSDSANGAQPHPWLAEMAVAGERLAGISRAGDAAAACFFRGWALRRLRRDAEAREALLMGRALAKSAQAKAEVIKQLERELSSMPATAGLSGLLVVEPTDSGEAVDPTRKVVVVQTEASSADGIESPDWQLLQCPKRFSWIIYAPPTTLFAACCSPEERQLPALQALSLSREVRADEPGRGEDPPVHMTVEAVAKALEAGEGCFLHSSAGSATVGVALACFICKYGFGYPEDWSPTQPAHAAAEAVDLVRGLQGEAALGGAEGEAAVAFFEKALWAEIMMGSVQKRSKAEAEVEVPSEVVSGKVVRQPGDGNCLFHSLAHVIGGEKAASLRRKICEFMQDNPSFEISGTSLTDWLQMSAQCSVTDYCKRMQRAGEWGGAPELAVCARMKGVNVHVYQPSGKGFELVAPFYGNEDGSPSGKTVSVVYVGQMHYDALIL